MKTFTNLLLLCTLLVAFGSTSKAQTNLPPITVTNMPPPPSVVGGLEKILGVFGGQAPTNITAGPFATTDTHGKNWGYGIAIAYNLNNNIAFALVVDSIPQKFTLFTGQVQFKLPVYPLAWTKNTTLSKWEVDPFAFAGVGSGIENNAGNTVSLVSAAGVNFPIAKVFGGQFAVAGWYEKLTGAGSFDGNRIGICPNWHLSF